MAKLSVNKKGRLIVQLKLFNSVSSNPTVTSVATGLVAVVSIVAQIFSVVASLNPLV